MPSLHRILRPRKVQIALGLAVLVVLGAGWARLGSETQFENRPLAYWLRELPLTVPTSSDDGFGYMELASATINGISCGASDSEETRYAAKAVRELGSKTLPILLKDLKRRDSGAKVFLAKLSRRIGYEPQWLVFPADARRGQAVTAFRILGEKARGAQPALERLAVSSDPNIQAASILILRGLSTNRPQNWEHPALPQW